MSENKFIKHLKGEQTAKSLIEIKNQATNLTFADMPQGTSNPNFAFSDHRGNATGVLNGTMNWKINGSAMSLASSVDGNGNDFLSVLPVSGSGLWINSAYTFPSTGDPLHPIAMVFNPNTKWVLKVCGDNLIVDGGKTVDFTLLVKIGSANIYTKNFTVAEHAGQFSQEFVLDFDETNSGIVKAGGLSTLTVQLLCGTANASARIYNGMTVLTCLQRKVDASAVSNANGNVEDILSGSIIPADYFSNPAFIDEVGDGDKAYAVFQRDGDTMNLAGWDEPIPDQTNNAGKFLSTDGTNMSWQDVLQDTDGITIDLNGSNQLQAIGVRNKNTAVGSTDPVYDWIGTYAEFTAQNIATLHPDWLCFITDDGGGVGGIYTAAECDARFSTKTETSTLLATKANVSADNFNDNGKAFISGLGRAGAKFEVLVPVNGGQYTAPANGYFVLDGIITNAAANRLYLLLKNEQYISNNKLGYQCFGVVSGYRQYSWVPVRKGDVVAVTAESTATSPDFGLRFYYAEGEHTTPPTYTEVEYIEGTYNTQYIKTGVVPASGMKLYCKIQNTGNTSNFGWGARNITYDGAQMNISVTNQYVVVDWFGASASDRWTVYTSVTSSDIFELTIENNVAVLTKNGTNIATHTFTPSTTITRELYLTAFNNNGALGGVGTTGRLYAFKLWTPNNELLLDMVPAKDGSGVACLYNRATDTLYYNQGTGTYTAGPEI